MDSRFEVIFSLAYGWHIVDRENGSVVVDEFGQYKDEAEEFCGVMNRMWEMQKCFLQSQSSC